jgi:hypothetical protein
MNEIFLGTEDESTSSAVKLFCHSTHGIKKER